MMIGLLLILQLGTPPVYDRVILGARGLVVAPGFIDLHAHGQTPEMMDAIRKMTLIPAQRLERQVPMMRQKGRLRVGAVRAPR
jgi:dihydroorotase-like cyclic amidohydrolase